MKKLKIILMMFVFCIYSIQAVAQDIIRLTNGEWKPFQSKELPNYGPYSEIAKLAFSRVGIEVEFGFFPWNRAMKLVESGRWDGTFFWVSTEEREKKFLISAPVITLKEVLYYSKDNPLKIDKFSNFENLVMGRIQSSAFGNQFKDLIEDGTLNVTVVPTNANLFKMLATGRIDFVPELLNSGYNAIDSLPNDIDKSKLVHMDKYQYDWVSHLLISKKIKDGAYYIDAFNKGFKIIQSEGLVKKILDPVLQPKRYQ